MLIIEDITDKKANDSDLVLCIEGKEGFQSGLIHLQNVTVFRAPTGISVIFSHED
jgi:hypothetical protein